MQLDSPMSSVRFLHRAAAVLAVMALAVPASAGLRSSERDVQSCPQMQALCAHHAVVMTCCCKQDPPSPSTPGSRSTSTQGAPDSYGSASTAVPSPAAPSSAACIQSVLLRTSPPHGHRLADLAVLFSTFLI